MDCIAYRVFNISDCWVIECESFELGSFFVFLNDCNLYQYHPDKGHNHRLNTCVREITTTKDNTYRIKRRYKVIKI